MKSIIENELNKKGIKELDYITEDGRFYKNLKSGENKSRGYYGAINVSENNVELIYILKNFDKIDGLKTFLVVDNYDGQSDKVEISNFDGRDYLEIYSEYENDKYAFMKKEYLGDMYIKVFQSEQDIYSEKLQSLGEMILDKIEEQDRKLSNSLVRTLFKRDN